MAVAHKKLSPSLAKRAAYPKFFVPALCQLIAEPFDDAETFFEVKFDGVRALAFKKGPKVSLVTRRGNDISYQFPEIAAAVARLPYKNFVLDGEITAISNTNILGFQDIQPRLGIGTDEDISTLVTKHPVAFFVFDLPYFEGRSFVRVPFIERKNFLERVVPKKGLVQFVPAVPKTGKKFFRLMMQKGFEGMVAKHAESEYVAGTRIWQKIKGNNQQEFIICGWTEGKGARNDVFGALILGTHDPKTKKLIHMGNVGTGFNDQMLLDLMKKFRKLERQTSPFETYGLMAARPHWMRPQFVCEVKYAEVTRDVKLRKPVFVGLRVDKKPKDVILERPK